jgi:hypothetical protein
MIKRYMIAFLVIFAVCCIFADENADSIENVDYAVSISILSEGSEESGATDNVTKIRLYVADLIEYRGSSEQMLETAEYTYDVNDVSEIFELYREENGRRLAMSHIKKISVEEPLKSEEDYQHILFELSDYVDMTDAVNVEIGGDSIGLRSYMRRFYVA